MLLDDGDKLANTLAADSGDDLTAGEGAHLPNLAQQSMALSERKLQLEQQLVKAKEKRQRLEDASKKQQPPSNEPDERREMGSDQDGANGDRNLPREELLKRKKERLRLLLSKQQRLKS